MTTNLKPPKIISLENISSLNGFIIIECVCIKESSSHLSGVALCCSTNGNEKRKKKLLKTQILMYLKKSGNISFT